MLTGLLLAVVVMGPAAGPPLSATARALMAVADERQRWGAFLGLRAPDAWLLDPDLQPAALVLGRRADPTRPRRWWPVRTVTSCDGGLAFASDVSDGAGPGDRHLTIWERQHDRSWRWIFDGLADPDGSAPVAAVTAACGPQPAALPDPAAEAAGTSGDGTLRWALVRDADRDRRRLVVRYVTPAGWSVFADAAVR